MSRKCSKKTGGCGEGQAGGAANSGKSYIVKQAALGAEIAKSLGVKQGPTMVRLISFLRKKGGNSGMSAEQSLVAAKTYFNSHKEEARAEYKKLDANKPVRGKSSKKTSKKKEKTDEAKPKKKSKKTKTM